MGFTTTVLDVTELKRSIFEIMPIFTCMAFRELTVADRTIYKETLDFTDVDYLMISATIVAGAGNTDIALQIGGVTKWSEVTAGTENHTETIDCTAITGEKLVYLQADNSANNGYVTNINIWTVNA